MPRTSSLKSWLLAGAALLAGAVRAQTPAAPPFRAPAYPLITHDPYLSLWAFQDTLTAGPTRHWTGEPQSLEGVVRVDGKAYQFLGRAAPQYRTIIPTVQEQPYSARYTLSKPAAGWEKTQFAAANAWKTGPAPFTDDKSRHGTTWTEGDVWVRRTVNVTEMPTTGKLALMLWHDDAAEVYLNGVLLTKQPEYNGKYEAFAVPETARKALHKGPNLLALHATSPQGGEYLDAGLYEELPQLALGTARQTNVSLTATQTSYSFAAGPVRLTVNFLSPLLLDELETVARPVSYVTFGATAADGRPHAVQVLLTAAGTLAANTPYQAMTTQAGTTTGLQWQAIGTKAQHVLGTRGDNVRIDWGYAYLAAPPASRAGAGPPAALKSAFVRTGQLPAAGAAATGPAQRLALGTVLDLGQVGATAAEQHVLVGYDDLYSVQYFGQNLRGWWRRDPATTMPSTLQAAEADYARLRQKATAFDQQLRQEAEAAGGREYARLCELAYRQAIAAHKVVAGPKGEPLFFSKENFSNGSIGTVDITYPSAPLFLRYNPTLLKGMMTPIFQYSESGKWTKPFAAHDVGTYPLANGQTYGEDMPVEESGNMLILTAAIAAAEGNADYARQHWPTLTTWAEYLKKNGLDPENQLSTDDFSGHLAHNANLSVKAILALASYGRLAGMQGDPATAAAYYQLAQGMAQKWTQMARDGAHYSLTFDKKGTWSQKYNLVWDKVLQLNVFPPAVAAQEVAYYLTQQQPFGLPLDSRKTYSKSDWIMWTATLANSEADFQKLTDPVYRYVTETPTRIPLSDWHETTDAKSVGFRARSVVGGYFMKVLAQQMSQKKL